MVSETERHCVDHLLVDSLMTRLWCDWRRPLARVEAFSNGARGKQLGALKGSMRIRGDLVRADTTGDWETLK